MFTFPSIFRVRQTFDCPRITNVEAEVVHQLAKLQLQEKVQPGQSVAITVGSRGIANLVSIVKAIVTHFKQLKLKPFIVSAMGSHGGGTAEGQQKLLASYGITEETVGCPVRSGIETVVVTQAAEGFPIHFDRLAFEADHVFVFNRIKPHTGFCGPIESGLMKMLLIGLGNCEGARVYHRAIQDFSFEQIIRSVASEVLQRCHILAGLAVVENAWDETALIEAILPEQFETREPELLKLARQWLPRLPFDRVDVLVVDRIGKDISGTGMDPNVIGRKFNDHKALDDEWPKVRRIAVRGLTEATHGNALGLGMAEFCLSRVLEKADFTAMRLNALTSGHIAAAMTPLDYPTDREMLIAALDTIGLTKPQDARLLWISDTLHLTEVECSAAYLPEAQKHPDLEILTPLRHLPFDKDGNLPEFVLKWR